MKICVNGEMRDMTPEEQAEYEAYFLTEDYLAEQADNIRNLRTEKLKDTDWTQVPDSPVDQTAWAVYRQQLRDITEQEGFPTNVVWPSKPD